MAEGSVVFLLNKLAEFLQKEGNLLSEVRADADYINDELEFMVTFLRVAETMEDSDPQLKVFAKKVRYLVHDMEDALDDFKFHLTSDHGYGFLASLKMIHFLKTLKARRQITLHLKAIKLRVIGISEQHRRYLIKNNIMEQGSSSTSERQLSRRGDVLLLEEAANPVGIEQPKMQLIRWLFEDKSKCEVISVIGMGGLGKTTLVRKVYNDKEVKKHFEFHAWITLSSSFTTENFIKDIIQQLSHVLLIADPQVNLRMAIINEFLQERKYLIVVDNVSDSEAWDDLIHVLPNNSRGSRILLTTRNFDVALASSPDRVCILNPLSEQESWTLLCRRVFQNKPCPTYLQDVLQKILVRCQGLPLAIATVGGVLATKDINKLDEWEMVHRCLGAALEDDRLQGILSLSYNDLPYYLKYCLLYFGIFPVGSPIELKRLVRLWVAEGFVKEIEGMTLEEVAESYLNELIKRSLVQVVEQTSDGRVKACRVHNILLEMIIVKSKDQEFVAVANKWSMMWPEKVRRLAIHNVDVLNIQQKLNSSRLRSLLLFSGSDYMPESILLNLSSRRLRLLKVLDLGGTPLKKFPNQVADLCHLKYLSLRNTKVNSIPSSIGKLQNLETLDLKHAFITELPAEVLKLQKLRHLLVYRYEIESDDHIHTKYGFRAPNHQIGSLQCIQQLCFLEATQGRDLMIELGKLNQLRRLGIVKLRREDGMVLCSSIEMLRNLRALSITSIEESEIIDIDNLSSPPRFLQRLYLTGHLEKLPNWISLIDSLVKLVLKWSGLSEDPLPSLQHLPNLLHLEFVQVYDGECLCFQAQGFQRLKFLGLNKLHGLKEITIEQGGMPCLEKLIVQNCGSLHRVPVGIENLTELKVLEYFNMPLELIMALHPSGGVDYSKVERVPEVYFTYWHDGNWDIISLESFKEAKSFAHSASSLIQRPRHIWK